MRKARLERTPLGSLPPITTISVSDTILTHESKEENILPFIEYLLMPAVESQIKCSSCDCSRNNEGFLKYEQLLIEPLILYWNFPFITIEFTCEISEFFFSF